MDYGFIGRDNELAIARRTITAHPADYSHICFFHGKSGVGKTTLCRYIHKYVLKKDYATFTSVFLDARAGDLSSENTAVRSIYEQLVRADKGFSFPNYELACAYLTRTRGIEKYKIDRPRIIDNEILNDFLEYASGKFKYSAVLNYVAQKIINGIYERTQIQKQNQIVNQYDEWTIEDHLIDLFIQDFNNMQDSLGANKGGQQVVFLCDSFEHRSYHYERDWVTEKLIPNLRRASWIIFSTEEELDCTLDGIALFSHEIKPFDTSQTDILLNVLSVQDSRARRFITEVSNGLPAAIQILAQIYHDNGDEIGPDIGAAGYRALFEQYFSKHLDEKSRSIAKRMSVFDAWDQSLYISTVGSSEGFHWLTNNTALVEKIQDGAGRYRFVNIVQEAMFATFDQKNDPLLIAGQRGKFTYYSCEANRIIEIISDAHGSISHEIYKLLATYCKYAFEGAIYGYVDKPSFRAYSDWCINTEQFMSKIGFFDLKAKLLNQYIQGVLRRDRFQFDRKDSTDIKESRYYLDALRDLTWAYRNTGEWSKAINCAEEYYIESIKRYGVNSARIPFCLYLLGLTFRDVCDQETARHFFDESVRLYHSIAKTDEAHLHPDTTEVNLVLVYNLLGYMCIDNKEFPMAQKYLSMAQNLRSAQDHAGQRIGFGNFSKLYFCCALAEAKLGNNERAGLCLQRAEEYLRSASEVNSDASEVERLVDDTRAVILSLTKLIVQNENAFATPVLADYYRALIEKKNALIDLGQSSSTYPVVLSIENNLAVICALQRNFEGARQAIEKCLDRKCDFYAVKEIREEYPDTNQRIIELMNNRPTIADTKHNQELIQYYIRNTDAPFNPYDFIIQY